MPWASLLWFEGNISIYFLIFMACYLVVCKHVIMLDNGVLISLVTIFYALVELSLEIIYSLNILLVRLFEGTCSCEECVLIEYRIGIHSSLEFVNLAKGIK